MILEVEVAVHFFGGRGEVVRLLLVAKQPWTPILNKLYMTRIHESNLTKADNVAGHRLPVPS